MKIQQVSKKIPLKLVRRVRRKRRVRGKISGTAMCPRISVFRSNRHLFVQAIDDGAQKTYGSVSSYGKENRVCNVTIEFAKKLGAQFSSALREKNIESVVFDRNGYRYHGVIKAFADGMRENITF